MTAASPQREHHTDAKHHLRRLERLFAGSDFVHLTVVGALIPSLTSFPISVNSCFPANT
jgi:hypothetical protein